MQNRWAVLGVLFLARMMMGFQFQAVPALSPLMIDAYGIDLTALGLLIALYLWPGVVVAFPGGAIGARWGDARVVSLGLVLMIAGGALVAAVPVWEAQLAGRLMGGTGGILLNVLMTKLVTDQFAGREIATAMGIFVNSWPVGIALALVSLPWLAATGGLAAAYWAVTGLCAAALVVFVLTIRPASGGGAAPAARVPLRGRALQGVLVAGTIWGFYNAGLAMVFGFGPAMLAEVGLTPVSAAATSSVVLWALAVTAPLGGVISDRTGKPGLIIVLSVTGFAVAMLLGAETGWRLTAFVVMGVLGGLGAGPIMALASRVLDPGNRATGMGLFYTLYYVIMAASPVIAGAWAEAAGTGRAAFHYGALVVLACLGLLAVFRMIERRTA